MALCGISLKVVPKEVGQISYENMNLKDWYGSKTQKKIVYTRLNYLVDRKVKKVKNVGDCLSA